MCQWCNSQNEVDITGHRTRFDLDGRQTKAAKIESAEIKIWRLEVSTCWLSTGEGEAKRCSSRIALQMSLLRDDQNFSLKLQWIQRSRREWVDTACFYAMILVCLFVKIKRAQRFTIRLQYAIYLLKTIFRIQFTSSCCFNKGQWIIIGICSRFCTRAFSCLEEDFVCSWNETELTLSSGTARDGSTESRPHPATDIPSQPLISLWLRHKEICAFFWAQILTHSGCMRMRGEISLCHWPLNPYNTIHKIKHFVANLIVFLATPLECGNLDLMRTCFDPVWSGFGGGSRCLLRRCVTFLWTSGTCNAVNSSCTRCSSVH